MQDLTGNTLEFANACCSWNTIEELEEALEEFLPMMDCVQWCISPTEWRDAVNAAIKWLTD